MSDLASAPPTSALSDQVDAWLQSSIARRYSSANTEILRHKLDAHSQANDRAGRVRAMADLVSFTGGATFAEQVEVAVAALSAGVSRVVSLSNPGRDDQVAWDSHAINESWQSVMFQDLFSDLDDLMTTLSITPSGDGMMSDDTVVVVLSEMARTPLLNGSNGRDHWPCTSAMIIGPGVAGGRMVGGYNTKMYGRPVDITTGEIDEDGTWLAPEHLGATLLALADIDPAEYDVPAEPLSAIIA